MELHNTKPVSLPIEYRNGSAVYFFFAVPTNKAREALNGLYEPAPLAFGKSFVALCFYQYQDTSIGPYNELGLGVMVRGESGASWLPFEFLRNASARKTGFHILSLPVTSQAANDAGREIWGLPKFVTEIPFNLKDSQFQGAVQSPSSANTALFTVKASLGRGVGSKGLDSVLYNKSRKDSQSEEKTLVDVQARFHTTRCANFSMTIESGNHPLQSVLRNLNLDSATPLAAQYTTHFKARLFGPSNIRD